MVSAIASAEVPAIALAEVAATPASTEAAAASAAAAASVEAAAAAVVAVIDDVAAPEVSNPPFHGCFENSPYDIQSKARARSRRRLPDGDRDHPSR